MANYDPTKTTDPSDQIQFHQLLNEDVTKPGTLMKAYSLFWNYSLGNQEVDESLALVLAVLSAPQKNSTPEN